MALRDLLLAVPDPEATYRGEIAPGVHAFGADRPMSRVRAYQSAVLSPIGGRGSPKEVVLLAHVHEQSGKAVRVEGFNGPEGEELADRIAEALKQAGELAPNAVVRRFTPLRECGHSSRTLPSER